MANQLKTFNVTVIGPPGVGKKALINRFVLNHFFSGRDVTLGSVGTKQAIVEGIPVTIEVAPTRGLSTEDSIDRLSYYVIKSHVVLLVCSLSSRASLDVIEAVYHRLREIPGGKGRRTQMCLVSTKLDIMDFGQNELELTDVGEVAQSMGIPYVGTSARTGTGVEDAFLEPVRIIQRTRTPDLKAHRSEKPTKQKKQSSGDGFFTKLFCCGLGVVDKGDET